MGSEEEIKNGFLSISSEIKLLKEALTRLEKDHENLEEYFDINYYGNKDLQELQEEYVSEYYIDEYKGIGKAQIDIKEFMDKPINEKLLVILIDQVNYNTQRASNFYDLTKQIEILKWVASISLILICAILGRLFL